MHLTDDDKKTRAKRAFHERPTWPAGAPRLCPPVAEDPKRRQVGAFKPPVGFPTDRGRILAVDDEPLILTMLTRLLREDHNLVVAGSGKAAQDILEQDTRFDLVLCDMAMPELSGIDLYEWLAKRSPELAERIVFITGGTFTPRAVEFLSKINNPIVDKPFDLDKLRSLIVEYVSGSK